MFNWWRNLTIPRRFLVRATFGMSALVLFLLSGPPASAWLVAALLLEFLTAIAGYSALDARFDDWRPASRSGRWLRAWMYSPWYFRHGEGKRWVRLAFGIVGIALMGLVAFGLVWAAFA